MIPLAEKLCFYFIKGR